MARTPRLTDAKIKKLGVKDVGLWADQEVPGLFVRVKEKSGAMSYTIIARDPWGKQKWCAIPDTDPKVHALKDVRERAREGIKRIKAGAEEAFPAAAARPDTFKSVAEKWIEQYVIPEGLRSRAEIERCLKTYVYPVWQDRAFIGIRRGDINGLRNGISTKHGKRQGELVFAIIRSLMNWWVSDGDAPDDYLVPIVRTSRKGSGSAKKGRERILSDEEIRLIWPILGERGTFGAILKLGLLTGQRENKLATMKWSDVSVDGVWRIATEAREKGNAGTLALPKMALDIIQAQAQTRIEGNEYVFPGRGDGNFASWSRYKDALDEEIARALRKAAAERGGESKQIEPWRIHDLRRTAKSLMMRAGVDRFHAERVLGHVIPGVEGIYDRHDYSAERRHALAALATLLDRILNPLADNVVSLGSTRA
jgi:integrase